MQAPLITLPQRLGYQWEISTLHCIYVRLRTTRMANLTLTPLAIGRDSGGLSSTAIVTSSEVADTVSELFNYTAGHLDNLYYCPNGTTTSAEDNLPWTTSHGVHRAGAQYTVWICLQTQPAGLHPGGLWEYLCGSVHPTAPRAHQGIVMAGQAPIVDRHTYLTPRYCYG